jgi:hypothetical protein
MISYTENIAGRNVRTASPKGEILFAPPSVIYEFDSRFDRNRLPFDKALPVWPPEVLEKLGE